MGWAHRRSTRAESSPARTTPWHHPRSRRGLSSDERFLLIKPLNRILLHWLIIVGVNLVHFGTLGALMAFPPTPPHDDTASLKGTSMVAESWTGTWGQVGWLSVHGPHISRDLSRACIIIHNLIMIYGSLYIKICLKRIHRSVCSYRFESSPWTYTFWCVRA